MPASPILNVGFYNYVVAQRIIALVSSESAPMRRLVQTMRKSGSLIDATQGRRTKSILFTDNGSIILSAISQETLAKRLGSDSSLDELQVETNNENNLEITTTEWDENNA